MYQKIIVVGNLGRDPEMRYMQDGKGVTNFSMATNRRWISTDGEPKEETTWFNITVWGRQAEACNQYLSKGSKALVEGRMKAGEFGSPRIWTRSDGTPAASFEITADSVQFLSSRAEDQEHRNGNGGGYEQGNDSQYVSQEDDDIPF